MVVADRITDSTGNSYPDCADYETPELADGGVFGPKAVCFLLNVPADGRLTLRWTHPLGDGGDQDLELQ